MFSTPTGLPLQELSFGSNEDILRVFQDLDLTKIANVLKTLGEAAAAANVPLGAPPVFMPPPPQQVALTPLGQVPTDSGAILGHPVKHTKDQGHRRKLDLGSEQHANPEHAQWLATKWMNAAKLAELVKTHGAS
jgi:Myb-like DNA-binding protein REB1